MAIKKLKSGWQADYRDDRGVRIRKTYRLRADADRFIREQKDAIDNGTYISPRQSPTFEEMAELWYQQKTSGVGCKRVPRPSTLSAWRIHLDRHLIPKLGEKTLDRIGTDLDQLRDELQGGDEEVKGLLPQTVNKVLVTATSIFKLAIEKKRTRENPAANTKRLGLDDGEITEGNERKGNEALREDDVLSPDEISRLIAVTESDIYGTLVLTAIFTGARHDELLALKWGAIDLEAASLWIRESITWSRLKGETFTERWRFYPPKTKAGVRQLDDLPSELIARLKRWKLKCPPSKLDLVFPTPDGTPIQRHHTLRCGLHPLLRRAGLRTVNMHSLRHSFASMLIMEGSPVTEVSALLGHSNPTTTLSIYSHWFKGVKTGAVANLARKLMERKLEKVGS